MRVHIAEIISDAQRDDLRSIAGPDTITFAGDPEFADPTALEAEVVFGNPAVRLLAQSQRLRWLQLASVGFDEYRSVQWSRPEPPIVTNLGDSLADQVAQSGLAGLLALVRGIDRLTILKDEHRWEKDFVRSRLWTLESPSVLFIGFGATNRRFAELLAPFSPVVRTVTSTSSDLDAQLPLADIVVCAIPETDQTLGLLDERRLALLRPSAVVVNLGRGSAIDEAALIARLGAGIIAGAVLDVTRSEPLLPEDSAWSTPNLVLTQHTAGGARDELDRKLSVFKRNLDLFRGGQSLMHQVDLNRGY